MNFERCRHQMVDEQLKRRGILDYRLLDAMGNVPRHRFVPPELVYSAYHDGPLSIGKGQTISQPYMVALMTECLELEGEEKVLEIGTGSGYQTAILAELAKEIFTIEVHRHLSDKAKALLADLGYKNIEFKIDDGSKGWEEEAPFHGIIVTAGAPEIPTSLKDQLIERGRLVVPIGTRSFQTLYKITKQGDSFIKKAFTSCIFVPLVGEYGWKED
ncbi:MAG: protein-L-isoaspartate(D-aspartate) O-methyltransferase [Thermodesulfobacteriota bacterium]|nr:protein-L-isoaspartate(D-aspartate) O-methyltransferase [Thermodesulfobacteriota bacterium]